MSGGNMPYLCNQDLEELTTEIINHSATVRKCTVEAFLQAWETMCTWTNCLAGAHEVALLEDKNFEGNRFCRVESRKRKEAERQRESQKLYISNCLVTNKVRRY